MSTNHSVANPVRYSSVGSKTAFEGSVIFTLYYLLQSLAAKMDKRMIFFACLLIYYAIEIAVLTERGQQFFLKILESLMLVSTCLTLGGMILGGYKTSRVILFLDSCLFGLTIGWMLFAATNVENDVALSAFFTLNGVVVVLLIFLDVRMRQNQQLNDTIGGDAINEAPGHGTDGNFTDNGASKMTSTDKTVSAHDPNDRHSLAQGYNQNNGGDLESNSEFDFNSKALSLQAPSSISDSLMKLSDEDVFDGFRVKIDKLPLSNLNIPTDVPWESFSYLEHRVDSSSCHIYSAFWRGTAVIIKLIKADRVASPMAVAEFQTEASILSRLEHPHIVKLLGSGRYPRRFLILELLDGGSLSHSLGLRAGSNNRVTKKKFSYLETLQLARALASALDYLHNQWQSSIHVIHRDLKPDNIGFTADGNLKLFDFGLCACVRTHGNRRDQYRLTGNTGTLRYMAPEVALGRQYNCSVDVYSFGVIVWQVLRSKVPFRDMGKKAYIQDVVIGGKRPPLDRRWPIGFSRLLEKCWHEDKHFRPSFSQVVSELDVLIEEATGLGSVSVIMQINHRIRRLKGSTTTCLLRYRSIIAALISALVVVSILILLLGGRVGGSSLAVVSSSVLYLLGMLYIQGDVKGDQENTASKVSSIGSRAQKIIQMFRGGRQRAPSVTMLELKRRSTDPHTLSSSAMSPSGIRVEGCLGVVEFVSFNPLSPHSVHHSSEGDHEGYYMRGESRDVGKEIHSRPATEAGI